MFTKEDRKNFGILAELATKRYEEDNAFLRKYLDAIKEECADLSNKRYWLEGANKALKAKNRELQTKCELYEKFISKITNEDKSNSVFMLDGEIYRISNYCVEVPEDGTKVLKADFVCTTGVTKNFKIGFVDIDKEKKND